MSPIPPVPLFPLPKGTEKIGGFVVAVLIGLALYAAMKKNDPAQKKR